jgi:hypothetical protein
MKKTKNNILRFDLLTAKRSPTKLSSVVRQTDLSAKTLIARQIIGQKA